MTRSRTCNLKGIYTNGGGRKKDLSFNVWTFQKQSNSTPTPV